MWTRYLLLIGQRVKMMQTPIMAKAHRRSASAVHEVFHLHVGEPNMELHITNDL